MPEEFETEALQYLLDELTPERRLAFEQRLANDPAAREAFKACADSLAGFACECAPAEPMLPGDQRVTLAAIAAATATAPTRASEEKVIVWSRHFWPVAAALLLGLNLLQFQRPIPTRTGNASENPPASRGTPASREPAAELARHEAPEEGEASASASGPNAETARSSNASALAPTRVAAAQSKADERSLIQLRQDYAELQRTNSLLRADYEAILRHIADRALLDKNVGRLAAMELVDAGSYARGERKGLMEIARGILTEPGVVVAEIATLPTVSAVPQEPEVTVASTFGPATPPRSPAPEPAAPSPYAWAVFDDKEHRGYLNLYNLPTVSADQSLQLWVKAADGATFQRVGEVPAQPGGNGSFYYTLPTDSPPPAEILVTQEPRNTTPVQPSAEVVLRGP